MIIKNESKYFKNLMLKVIMFSSIILFVGSFIESDASEAFYEKYSHGRAADLTDYLALTYYNQTLSGELTHDKQLIEFNTVPISFYGEDKFKIRDIENKIIISGENLEGVNFELFVFLLNEKEVLNFKMFSISEKQIIHRNPIIQKENKTNIVTENYEEYLKEPLNIPVGNYSNNIIQVTKDTIINSYYISMNVGDIFLNDHTNQLEAHVYNRDKDVAGLTITFDLIKNGIVEATYSGETYYDLGVRGVWKLNELLTPAGCYNLVVSSVVDGEELQVSKEIKVRRAVGMSQDTIDELHTCDVD